MPKKKEPKVEVVKENGVGEIQEPFIDENETEDIPLVDPEKIQEDIEEETKDIPEAKEEPKEKKPSKSQLEISKENIKKRIAELFQKMSFTLEDEREHETAIGVIYNMVYLMDENWFRIKNLPEDENGNIKFSAAFQLYIHGTEVETKVAFTERHTSKAKFKGKDPNQPELAFEKAKEEAKEVIDKFQPLNFPMFPDRFSKVESGDLKMSLVHHIYPDYEALKPGLKIMISNGNCPGAFRETEKTIISCRDVFITSDFIKVDGKKYKEEDHLVKQLGYESMDEFESYLTATCKGEFKGKIITWN